MKIRIINKLVMVINKKYFINKYSKEFYKNFVCAVKKELSKIIPEVPAIGESIFKTSYEMGIFYIAWFKVLKKNKISSDEASRVIWDATENCLRMIPKVFVPIAKRIYINPMIRKAIPHTEKSKNNTLPEYDWKIEYKKIDENCFYLNTYECGIKKLCDKFGVSEMLPSLCRMDYLTSHYLKCGFERTKTLGDGNEVCNNKFYINGECEWAPEKGFIVRK